MKEIQGVIRTRSNGFMFKKGSRFKSLFDKAIASNHHRIQQIIKKYMTYMTPSRCERNNYGPLPLCKSFIGS